MKTNHGLTDRRKELAALNAFEAAGGTLRFREDETITITGRHEGTGRTLVLPLTGMCTGFKGETLLLFPDNLTAAWDRLSCDEKTAVTGLVLRTQSIPAGLLLAGEKELKEQYGLRRLNRNFIHTHGDLSEEDFGKMEYVRKVIETARTGEPAPLPGDTVEGTYYEGKRPFMKGMLDTPYRWYGPDEMNLCAGPYSPFVSLTKQRPEGYAFSMSGGPFFKIRTSDLEYLGKDRRVFTVWGYNGPCADGSIVFEAEVNRWKLKEGTDI